MRQVLEEAGDELMICSCSLAGTSACASCFYNPNGTRQVNNFMTWNTSTEMSYEDALILLDELGLSERTCHIIGFDDGVDEGIDGEWHQYAEPQYDLSCGHSSYGAEAPNYCPNCGAKVVGE